MLVPSEICLVFLVLARVIAVRSFTEEKEQDKYTTALLNITYCDPHRKHCDVSVSKKGAYGTHSMQEDASGWLYTLNEDNENGCDEFSIEVQVRPWIALVRRGSCRFNTKIANAFKYNATAIIIYDSQDSDDVITMLNAGAPNLVSVSITKRLGEYLADKLRNNSRAIYAEILVGEKHSKWRVNPTSVLFVSVSFIVLMVISLAWLVFYYVQRFRYVHARDKTEKRLSSAAKKAIAKLPTRTVKKDEEEEIDSCPVCLDGYKSGEVIRILPCNHEYHKLCIDPWLVEHRTCPMCKLNILKELGVPSSTESQVSRNIEVATVEPQDYEDHASAVDNPVLYLGDVEPGSLQSSRRPSCGGESSGSSDSSARVLHISADVNWERDEQSSSTSNLVDSTVRT